MAELLEEKCKVLETLSECEHKVGEEQVTALEVRIDLKHPFQVLKVFYS